MKADTRRQLRRLAAHGFLSALLIATTECSSSNLKQIDLYKTGAVKVSLRYFVDGGHPQPQGYGQPARLTAEEVKRMLGAVGSQEYAYMKWRDQGPLFNEDELALLAPRLAEGLQKATADQWVHFAVSGVRDRLIFVSGRYTDGICFVKDGKFNLVLGNIGFTANDALPGMAEPTPVDPRNLKEFDYARLAVNPESGPGVGIPAVVPGDRWFDVERRNWLVFDLATFLGPAPERPQSTAAPAPSAAEPSPSLDAGERLLRLKDLRDRGLITADEYEKKRQEILKGL